MGASRIGCWVAALALVSRGVEAQYRPEIFAGPVVGRIHSGPGNATVGGLNLGIGIGIAGQSWLIGPEVLLLSGGARRVRAFDLAIRLRQQVGVVHPHLMASIGAYAWQVASTLFLPELVVVGEPDWRETDDFTGSIGAGLTVGSLTTTLSGIVESRWHRSLSQNAGGSRSLLTLAAGLRLSW